MKKRSILIISFILFQVVFITSINSILHASTVMPKAVDGVVDLRNWNFNSMGPVTLSGDWEFYWKQLLTPEDFTGSKTIEKTGLLQMPGVWNKYKTGDAVLDGDGYATFRLKILTADSEKKIGIEIPYHFSSYRLWCNGSELASNGTVGTSRETSIPQTLPQTVYLKPVNNQIDLVLQMSNYQMNKGGAPAPYKIGLESQITKQKNKQLFWDIFLTGCMVIMALYHFGLFFLRKKDQSTLYFGMFCLIMMIWIIGLGETIIIKFIPDFNFEIYIKILFAAFILSIPFAVKFVGSVFPEDKNLFLERFLFYTGLASLSILIFPARFSSEAILYVELLAVIGMLYPIAVLGKALFKRREGANVAAIGLLTLFMTALNDILNDNQIITTGYYAPYGMFGFIFAQAFLLASNYTKAFNNIEQLSENIMKINKANSRFVPFEFISYLGHNSIIDVKLGDNIQKRMTILFADVRSFTSISEQLTPEEIFLFLNRLLGRLSPIVKEHNGFIDKYIGDSIMALFPNDPRDAVYASFEIMKKLEEFNSERIAAGEAPIKVGIGIHTGDLILGTIGEINRMEGTVISDSVNLASRLEGLTKNYKTSIIASGEVVKAFNAEDNIHSRFLGEVKVKGKAKSTEIFELYNHQSREIIEQKDELNTQFMNAVALFKKKDYEDAYACFDRLSLSHPEDISIKLYKERIHEFQKKNDLSSTDELTELSMNML